MNRVRFHSRLRAGAGSGGGGGGPTPSLSLDFTSTLPAQVTFSRTGSRTAIVAGVLTTIPTGQPAIESLTTTNLGLSIEPGSTNQLLQSNNFTTTWSAAVNVTPTSGQPSPDGGSNGWDIAETTASGYHEIAQNLAGVASGTVVCSSVFVKAKPGSTTNGMGLFNCNQFSNTGARAVGMVDASGAVMAYDTATIAGGTATFNAVSGGSQKLANGWTRIWCVGTATATGTKTMRLRSMAYNASGLGENYAGVAGNGYELAFAQTEFGVTRPTSYKATTTATVATNADSAIISNISWLDATQGTFVIEHDCASGVVLGSGANTIISGAAGAVPANRATGKVAIAYSGTTSDLVYNGGATTSGGLPSFGADIRLLSTSGVTNSGHIKSLTYYPTRLSVAQIQALTSATSTAVPGAYRVATHRNVLHNTTISIAGTQPYIAFDWPATVRGNRSKLRISVGNWYLNDATGDTNTGNDITIESVCLIRVATSEVIPLYASASRSAVITNGQVKLNFDDLLPSAVASLAAGNMFPDGDQYRIKGKVKCATGGKIPVGRWGNETGATCYQYDASVTNMSAVDSAAAFSSTGTAATTATKGFSVVVEGPFVSGDPLTIVGYGDSIVEGVGATVIASGTWFQKTADSLGAAYLQVALGGQSQVMFWKSSNVNQYCGLASVLIDNTGTNTQGGVMYFPLPYYNARQAGVRAIVRPSLNVRSTSTDSWATNANQTASLVYPDSTSIGLQALASSGFIDFYYKMNAVRDTGDKWITNGVAQTYTVDGVHQQPPGDDLMYAELKAQMQSLVLV